MPKISLIVPVYNADQFISRCIDSILAQKFTDFELILVDDGSSDDSLIICEHYSEKDPRVLVASQSNSGVSFARNKGIEIATGDYLCFVDADDYVGPSYLEQLYREAQLDNRIDMVIQGRIKCENNVQTQVLPQVEGTFFLNEDSNFFENINLFRFCSVFSKLYKRETILKNDIKFLNHLSHGEDFDFLVKCLLFCNGVRISSCSNYYYMINEGSLSSKFSSFEQEYGGMKSLYQSLSRLNDKFQNQALEQQFRSFISYYVSRVLSSIYESPKQKYKDRLKDLKSIDSTFVQIYKDYFIPPTLKNNVYKSLFVNRFYWLFDLATLMSRQKLNSCK